MYFNTFGGSPVAAAVGMAVLDVIEEQQLLNNAQSVGAYVQQRLQVLASKHSIIGDRAPVRGDVVQLAVHVERDALLERGERARDDHEARDDDALGREALQAPATGSVRCEHEGRSLLREAALGDRRGRGGRVVGAGATHGPDRSRNVTQDETSGSPRNGR